MSVSAQSPGIVDSGTNRVEMLLKQFGGEVIVEFQSAFKLRELHRMKALAPGRKADVFPAVGQTSFKYHQAGDNLLTDANFLQTILQGDRTIWADREAVSAIVLDDIEQRLSYWPDRESYVKQMAASLASNADQMVMRVLCRAARGYTPDPYTGAPVGAYVVPNDVGGTTGTEYSAAEFEDALSYARQLLLEKDFPVDDQMVAVISPSQMRLLLTSSATRDLINKDYNEMNGSLAKGVAYWLHGFRLVVSNNIPTDNYTAQDNYIAGEATSGNDYRIDMRDSLGVSGGSTRAICFHPTAVATVTSADISLESERKIELRGDLVVAGYSMGHGILRPEGVVEIACNTKPSAPA